MKITKVSKYVLIFTLVILLMIPIGYYLHLVNENNKLVKKYSDEFIVIEDVLSAQPAASLRSKNNKTGNKPTPSTSTSTNIVSTTTSIINPDITTFTAISSLATTTNPVPALAKTINGIAAGGVLTSMSETQLRNYFDILKRLGVTWVRWDMDWSKIQKDGSSSYDWNEVDRVVKIANEYKIESLAILGYAPTWTSEIGCIPSHQCAPSNTEAFSQFASQAATRYKGKVKNWEIWNEPNSQSFWSPKPSVEKYSELLKASYAAIKLIDPTNTVIVGGLSPVEGHSNTIEPVAFITSLYILNTQKSFDAIALHPYGYPLSSASTLPWSYWFQMYKVYDIMNKYGDSSKKIWITEYGAPSGGSGKAHDIATLNIFNYGKDYMSQDAQSTMMTDLIAEVSKIRTWVGPVFWYSLIDTNSKSDDPEGHFGLIKSDFVYKTAYYTLLQATQ